MTIAKELSVEYNVRGESTWSLEDEGGLDGPHRRSEVARNGLQMGKLWSNGMINYLCWRGLSRSEFLREKKKFQLGQGGEGYTL